MCEIINRDGEFYYEDHDGDEQGPFMTEEEAIINCDADEEAYYADREEYDDHELCDFCNGVDESDAVGEGE